MNSIDHKHLDGSYLIIKSNIIKIIDTILIKQIIIGILIHTENLIKTIISIIILLILIKIIK